MGQDNQQICVYYDGACPQCIKDRQQYEKLAGKNGENVCWIDITGNEQELQRLNIDPAKALTELHVKDENQRIVSEIDAYILLMSRVLLLKPLAYLIGLPVIKPIISRLYHYLVNRRLSRTGRI